jgi:inosose dehydratase
MSIQLAVAPIAWSNSDLPELGGETSLETCLRESREAGFTGTETGVKYPLDAEILGPLLETHGLQLASGWFSGTLRECSVEQEFLHPVDI